MSSDFLFVMPSFKRGVARTGRKPDPTGRSLSRSGDQSETESAQRPFPADPKGPTAIAQQTVFSGPLPHPEVLAYYDVVVPGSAERIIGMAERQAAQRQEQEAKVISGNVRAEARGQWFGFILGLAAIVGGVYLAPWVNPLAGWATVVTAIGGLAFVFIKGRTASQREIAEKREPSTDP